MSQGSVQNDMILTFKIIEPEDFMAFLIFLRLKFLDFFNLH